MQIATVTIEGISPYSQSRFHDPQAIGKESKDDLERRTWKERVHLNSEGLPFMPPMALKKALEGAAPYLGTIKGQGKATYTKRIKSGILITDEIELRKGKRRATADDFEGEWLFLDANGKPGGTRVKRCMPRLLAPWTAKATIYIVDEILTEDVIEKALTDAGMLVGVGRFRPAVGGFYGRFRPVDVKFN